MIYITVFSFLWGFYPSFLFGLLFFIFIQRKFWYFWDRIIGKDNAYVLMVFDDFNTLFSRIFNFQKRECKKTYYTANRLKFTDTDTKWKAMSYQESLASDNKNIWWEVKTKINYTDQLWTKNYSENTKSNNAKKDSNINSSETKSIFDNYESVMDKFDKK